MKDDGSSFLHKKGENSEIRKKKVFDVCWRKREERQKMLLKNLDLHLFIFRKARNKFYLSKSISVNQISKKYLDDIFCLMMNCDNL